jgi:hypothetical protein
MRDELLRGRFMVEVRAVLGYDAGTGITRSSTRDGSMKSTKH